MPARGIYEMTDVLVDWLSNTLEMFDESAFCHYQGIKQLVNIVKASEEGSLPKFAAYSAIRAHNEIHKTNITYNEIKDADVAFLLSDVGAWEVFTDDAKCLLLGDFDTAEDALVLAPPQVKFIAVWEPRGDLILYRSPHVGYRKLHLCIEDIDYGRGLIDGDLPTYVLPPEIEAALKPETMRGRLYAR